LIRSSFSSQHLQKLKYFLLGTEPEIVKILTQYRKQNAESWMNTMLNVKPLPFPCYEKYSQPFLLLLPGGKMSLLSKN